ncbi:MAG TPA: hypothetical protein DCX53_06160, partial [Anaerolineae bacterium]|nr:hypothetical protein [Anaerolineae bacterium]
MNSPLKNKQEKLNPETTTLINKETEIDSPRLSSLNTRTLDLLRALNAAAAEIQKSVHSEEQIYKGFTDQVSALGLRGGLAILDESRTSITVRAVSYSPAITKILTQLEKVLKVKTLGFSIPINKVKSYNQIIQTQKSIYKTDNTETIEQLLPPVARPFARNVINVFGKSPVVYAPLIVDMRVIGILNIAGPNLTEEDKPAIQAFANHIAIAITNIQLYMNAQVEISERKLAEAKIEQQYLELQTIYNITQQLQGLETPEELAKTIIATLEKNLGYEYLAVLLVDEASQALVPFAVSNQGKGPDKGKSDKLYIASHNLKVGDGIVGWVAQHGTSVRSGDVQNDPRYYGMRSNIQSELCVPLYMANRIIGVINSETSHPNAYTETDQRILETVSVQIGIAIQNSNLYQQIKTELNERKQTEEKLRESEERFRTLWESAVEGIVIHENGIILEVNPAMLKLIGVNREQVIGRSLVDFAPPDTREYIRQKVESPTTESYETYFVKPDGTTIHMEIVRTQFTLQKKDVRMISVRDITERKVAEEKLQQREERFRSLIENASDVITVIDDTAIIRYESPAIERILGYHPDELIGQLVFELIHPDDLEIVAEVLLRAFPTPGVVASVDFRFRHKDGSWRYLEAVGKSTFDENGRLIGIINSRDVTERKQAEETIHQYANELEHRVQERTIELIHANRAKDEFLANMSHELRTPLNSILGFSESLLEQRRGQLNEKQIQYVDLIHSSGGHLLGLINDILEVSKIEAGKLDLRPETVSAREICESSLNFIKEIALKKSISIDFNCDESVPMLRADPQRLKQILVNLLSNAVKFTPEKGKISLDVHINAANDQIHFSVTDTGIGIAPENLENLFTPFTQLDSSLSRQYEGTGLGLVLLLKLTELHGGSVHVESEPGKGSRFTVVLPWNSPKHLGQKEKEALFATSETMDESVSASQNHGTILLAEDNMANVLTVQEYLSDHGYKVAVAHNGLEAVATAETLLPDLILMDIQMPQLDGLEAIRRLRAKTEFASVPIIALTALAMPGDRERCFEAGAN